MKKYLLILIFLLVASVAFAQKVETKVLYSYDLWEQTYTLIEYKQDNSCRLLLSMNDNKTNTTSRYDEKYPTTFYIWSKWYTNPNSSEYKNIIQECKDFFYHGMLLIYLKTMKDVCDIAPCCTLLNYKLATHNYKDYIHVEYECTDLKQLFDVAWYYHGSGRGATLKKYAK